MRRRGFTRFFGYIDDFLLICETYDQCVRGLNVLLNLLRDLGFYVSWDKMEPPNTQVKYLGVIIDTVAMQLRLPADKLEKVCQTVNSFLHRTHANKRQLMSLAGSLAHCSKLVHGGRTFSRRVFNLIKLMPELGSVVRLPGWFGSDLEWWAKFVKCFNGTVGIVSQLCQCEHVMYTDSSLSGFGGWFGSDWFAGVWRLLSHQAVIQIPEFNFVAASTELDGSEDINILELWPVICAIKRWGPQVGNCRVILASDNLQVVRMVNVGNSKSIKCMNWIRELFWLCFVFNIQLVAVHIRSGDNVIADMLSRLSHPSVWNKFCQLC